MAPLDEDQVRLADDRHRDFLALQDTLHKVKNTMLAAIIPIMLGGLWTLVANHFQQKTLANEISRLNDQIDRMTGQMSRMNEKVIVMWANGGWASKYESDPPPTESEESTKTRRQ